MVLVILVSIILLVGLFALRQVRRINRRRMQQMAHINLQGFRDYGEDRNAEVAAHFQPRRTLFAPTRKFRRQNSNDQMNPMLHRKLPRSRMNPMHSRQTTAQLHTVELPTLRRKEALPRTSRQRRKFLVQENNDDCNTIELTPTNAFRSSPRSEGSSLLEYGYNLNKTEINPPNDVSTESPRVNFV